MAVATSKWIGNYKYLGWETWNPSEGYWNIVPPFKSQIALDNFYNKVSDFKTINQAKKWIKKNQKNIKEEDYLK